jgi:hypothetical protein
MTIMKLFNNCRLSNYLYFAGFIFFLTFSIIPSVIPVHASTNLTIFPPNSTPFGKPYSEWTVNWWKWFIEIPFDNNHPFLDPTGASCGRNQSGPVWFLSGNQGPVEKTCVIPSGKAILFPILNFECSYAEDKTLKTPADLLKCAQSGTDSMKILNFKYNGKEVPFDQIKQQFRVTSSPFAVNFPINNVFTGTPGPTTAVSDGYWIMFEPPSTGNYDIRFGGCGGVCKGAHASVNDFSVDVIYHLKVLS